MPFSDVIGQPAAVATLQTALVRRAVPQAYLFVGPDGTGKTTAALAFIAASACKKPAESGDACGVCVNCVRIRENTHPDVSRIAPDGEFTRIWQLWSRPGHPPGALETLPFAPVAAPKRFYLIEKAETLNDESANSLLKALEEPPPYVQFVLCVPAPTSVLPTILSRCQMVRFRPAPTDAIAEALTKRGLPQNEARVLAAYAEGLPGRAFRLADAPELQAQRESLLDLAARIAVSPPVAAFRLAEDLRNLAKPPKAKKGSDDEADAGERTVRGDLNRALDVLAAFFSDLLAVSLGGPNARIVHTERREAVVASASRYRSEQIAENLEALLLFRRHIARNANAQLATEVLMMQLVPKAASL